MIKDRENEGWDMNYKNYKIITLAVNAECKWPYVLAYLEEDGSRTLCKIKGSWKNKSISWVYLGHENESLKAEEKKKLINAENRKKISLKENGLTVLRPDYKLREKSKKIKFWIIFRNYKSTSFYIAYISIKASFYNGHEYLNIVKFEIYSKNLDAKLELNKTLEKKKLVWKRYWKILSQQQNCTKMDMLDIITQYMVKAFMRIEYRGTLRYIFSLVVRMENFFISN